MTYLNSFQDLIEQLPSAASFVTLSSAIRSLNVQAQDTGVIMTSEQTKTGWLIIIHEGQDTLRWRMNGEVDVTHLWPMQELAAEVTMIGAGHHAHDIDELARMLRV